MRFVYRVIWNSRRIDLSTPSKSYPQVRTYPQVVSNFVTNCYEISLNFVVSCPWSMVKYKYKEKDKND
jgi:hypothetical protein